ncbi:MAG: hypothetical protein LBJ10_01410 [Clostridiales bacterium]|jgi:multimeric flavodoxin WrbA|nr:hypothetical protein [Clostridiales bacterium]
MLLLHDIPAEQAAALSGALSGEFSDALSGAPGEQCSCFAAEPPVRACAGCFACWVKSPGRCAIPDRGQAFAGLLAEHGILAVASRLVFGGFSPSVKAVLDRSIGYMLPFFRVVGNAGGGRSGCNAGGNGGRGEMHHIKRNARPLSLRCFFYGDSIAPEDRDIAERLAAANALNLGAELSHVGFYPSAAALAGAVLLGDGLPGGRPASRAPGARARCAWPSSAKSLGAELSSKESPSEESRGAETPVGGKFADGAASRKLKIALLNGSPKGHASASQSLLAALRARLPQDAEIVAGNIPIHIPGRATGNIPSSTPGNIPSNIPSSTSGNIPSNISSSTPGNIPSHISSHISDARIPDGEGPNTAILAAMRGCDALVLAFPLYVDGLPSHVVRFLDGWRQEIGAACGGAKVYALANNGFYEARQNSLALAMLGRFCERAGLGWGMGAGIGAGGMIGAAPIGRGPLAKLGEALDGMARKIAGLQSADSVYAEPNFPRFLYILAAHVGWRKQGRANGLSPRQLRG